MSGTDTSKHWYSHAICFRSTSISWTTNKTKSGLTATVQCGTTNWSQSTQWQVHQATMRQSPILPDGCRKSKIADAPKMHQERAPASPSHLSHFPEVLLLVPGPPWRWEKELDSPEPSHHPSCSISLQITESRNGLSQKGP